MYNIRTGLIAMILVLLCGCQESNNHQEKEKKAVAEVRQLIQETFDDIWSSKNIASIQEHHTADFLLLEHGEVWNNKTIADWCRKAQKRDQGVERINSFEIIEAKLNGNKLWMAYHNRAEFRRDSLSSQGRWLESVVAVKKDKEWKLEMMHSTRVPQ